MPVDLDAANHTTVADTADAADASDAVSATSDVSASPHTAVEESSPSQESPTGTRRPVVVPVLPLHLLDTRRSVTGSIAGYGALFASGPALLHRRT